MKSRLLACAAFHLSAQSGCLRQEGSAPAADGEVVVKIGAIQPLTGPQAHLGKDNENGTRMAIDDANAKGIMIGGKQGPIRTAERG